MRKLRLLCLLAILPLTVSAQNTVNPALNDELLAATRKSDLTAVRALLERGADVNAKSPYGATPLFFACDRGSVEMVRLLLEKGADVNVQDTFYKATPTTWAMSKGNPEIIRLLVERGAREVGMALGFAVRGGHAEVVRAALARGGTKQESLDRLMRQAEQKGHTEIAAMLRQAGAKPLAAPALTPENMHSYAGSYKRENFTLNVRVSEGKLIAANEGFESALTPFSEHVFDVETLNGITVTFNFAGGRVVSLTWKTDNDEVVLQKGEAK